MNIEGHKKVLRDPGFPLFEARHSGFESKIGARFEIESIRERWDAKNNPRDYGIARNFGSGLRDWRTLLGTLNILVSLAAVFWMSRNGERCVTSKKRLRGRLSIHRRLKCPP